jgi:hypothetical protein
VLPAEFKALQAEANKQWEQDHLWEVELAEFLDRETDVSTLECLTRLQKGGYPIKFDRNDAMAMGDILRKFGFTKYKARRGEKTMNRYKKD